MEQLFKLKNEQLKNIIKHFNIHYHVKISELTNKKKLIDAITKHLIIENDYIYPIPNKYVYNHKPIYKPKKNKPSNNEDDEDDETQEEKEQKNKKYYNGVIDFIKSKINQLKYYVTRVLNNEIDNYQYDYFKNIYLNQRDHKNNELIKPYLQEYKKLLLQIKDL
jgi:hypothetical protein